MGGNKTLLLTIILINVVGVICLIYFSIPYLVHDTTVANPRAMLPAEAWDRAGMILTFGLVPLLGANVLNFLFLQTTQKRIKFLLYIPSMICFIIVVSYWTSALG